MLHLIVLFFGLFVILIMLGLVSLFFPRLGKTPEAQRKTAKMLLVFPALVALFLLLNYTHLAAPLARLLSFLFVEPFMVSFYEGLGTVAFYTTGALLVGKALVGGSLYLSGMHKDYIKGAHKITRDVGEYIFGLLILTFPSYTLSQLGALAQKDVALAGYASFILYLALLMVKRGLKKPDPSTSPLS